jgi:multidrug resistance protein, MATE family
MAGSAAHTDLRVAISYKQILSISLPIAAAILVPQLNFIINNIFLSGLGEASLGTAAITGVYYLVFALVGMGFNNGLQVLIARRAGENQPEAIGELFAQALRLCIIFSVIGIAFTYLVAPYLLQLTLKDPVIYETSVRFLKIRIWGLPFLYLYQLRNALLVGTSQTRFLIIGTLAETIANVFFDYGFIYGKFGLPRIGFDGAAWASLIAEFTGLAVIFIVIQRQKMHERFALYKSFRFNAALAKHILQQSAPLIVQYALSVIGWLFFYILVEHHGQTDLAISNTMRNLFGFFGVLTWSFAATTNTMVSNVIGQGLQHRVPELINKIMLVSVSSALFVCLLLNIFPEVFLSIFSQGDLFIERGIPVTRIVAVALVIMSVSVVWLNAVIGTGNTRISLIIEIVAIVAYSVYVYLVLEHWFLPITWGWASEWLYWFVLLAFSFYYIKKGNWKEKKI